MKEKIEATVLDAVVLVQLDIRSSELSCKVERLKDLPTENMPPEKLISSGVKHYVSPKLKAPFNMLRKRAERICSEIGFPLLKGWAIPKDAARKLDGDLRKMSSEFLDEADKLEQRLPAEFMEWERENPGWEHLLAERPDPAYIRSRYRFRHAMYRMRPAGDADDEDLNDAMGVTRGSLLEAILDDVAENATLILKESFTGKSQVMGRIMGPIGVLGNKLKGFAMLDPLVMPVASMIGEVIGNIGTTGKLLSVTHTSALRGLLQLLTDPVKLRQHGALQLNSLAVTVIENEPTSQGVLEIEPEAVAVVPPPTARVQPAAPILF